MARTYRSTPTYGCWARKPRIIQELAQFDVEYQESSSCRCAACSHSAMLADFDIAAGIRQNLQTLLDASTGHLSEADKEMLNTRANLDPSDRFPRVTTHLYGWILFLSVDEQIQEESIEAARACAFSEGVVGLLQAAYAADAMLLLLDADAEPVLGVPEREEDSQAA